MLHFPCKLQRKNRSRNQQANFFGIRKIFKPIPVTRAEIRKRILIADDHEVMRRGLQGLEESQEEWSVCGEAIEGNEAISKTRELRPDLLILDVGMPGVSGIEAASQSLKDDPNMKISFLHHV
ncbi:MAG TPA: response regulator transcription factor [Methylomirabilota bacterium]|jgi:CheY-like chemotaxis protein|nr:response regulator transcription factor [Methylomirabilota bacterium]